MPRVDVGNTHKSCKLVSEIQSQEIFHSMKDTNSSFLETFFNSVLIIDIHWDKHYTTTYYSYSNENHSKVNNFVGLK